MSKIELFRQSKAPVNLESYEAYQSDWVKYYDAVMSKYALDMEKIHKMLDYGELKLNKKHNKKVEIDFPSTPEAIDELCTQYGVPVMFAQRTDGKGLILLLMDDFGG
jgi:hypothetical protein